MEAFRIIRELKKGEMRTLPVLAGALFASLLAVVFMANLFLPDKKFSSEENRMLREFPRFSPYEYVEGRFESKMGDYAADQFLLRQRFIKVKAAADVTVGKLESKGVYRAKDDYLMEKITVPAPEKLAKTETALANFRSRYPNLSMNFLLAPNAANILKDKLPATVRMADQDKLIDAFYENIGSAGYRTVDVRESFRAKKDKVQLYYRTDHHWTADGAYLAYLQTVQDLGLDGTKGYTPHVVKNDFAGTLYSRSGFVNGTYDAIKIYLPKDESAFKGSVIYYADTKEKTTQFYQLKSLKSKDAYTVYGGRNHPLYTVKTPVASHKKLLLIKDSYANSVVPLLAQQYREIVVVDPRYFYDNVDDLIDAEGITDVLFLYNANTFFGDDSLAMMLGE